MFGNKWKKLSTSRIGTNFHGKKLDKRNIAKDTSLEVIFIREVNKRRDRSDGKKGDLDFRV